MLASGRRKASASSYISTNDKCFVLANICRRLFCSTFLLFSLISHSLLEVWSRRFCFVACQEGIQEEAATAQGKKVSRTVIFFISSKYPDWDLCEALVVSKALKISSHLRTTLCSGIETALKCQGWWNSCQILTTRICFNTSNKMYNFRSPRNSHTYPKNHFEAE